MPDVKVVVVGGAPIQVSPLVEEALVSADLVVAADSGAAAAVLLGRLPDVVVGDFDSLDPDSRDLLAGKGVPMVQYPVRKDKTDLHLALLEAQDRGAREVTVIGLLGGERTDHGVAAVLLLAREEFASLRLRAVDGAAEMTVVRDSAELRGKVGEIVTLLALTPTAHGLESTGLEYALQDASLSFGDSLGVSNTLVAPEARLSVRQGIVLVIHQHNFA